MMDKLRAYKQRGQNVVEVALMTLGGALLAVAFYLLALPLIQQVLEKVAQEFALLK
jgi:hypothetical protein